jgi:hypothetical protein
MKVSQGTKEQMRKQRKQPKETHPTEQTYPHSSERNPSQQAYQPPAKYSKKKLRTDGKTNGQNPLVTHS